jgi:hypothetical protein
LNLSKYFVEMLAIMTMHDDTIIPALQPLHVLYFNNPGNPTYESWGLLYQNGMILYSEKKNDSSDFHLIVFLSKDLKTKLELETQVWNIKSDSK